MIGKIFSLLIDKLPVLAAIMNTPLPVSYTHLLPGETEDMMLETIRFLANHTPPVDGIKLQLLHVLKGTKLAALYEAAPFPVMTMEEYIDLILKCIRLLPPHIVIHRLSGDGPKKLLIAPEWSGNKRLFLNSLTRALRETGAYQGEWHRPRPVSYTHLRLHHMQSPRWELQRFPPLIPTQNLRYNYGIV